MRTYARVLINHKGLTCVNCGQKAIEMHNDKECVKALQARVNTMVHNVTECEAHRNCYVAV